MEKIDKKPLGAVDALSAGFDLVLHQPWVLLVPLALDLFLWLGPQIHAKPVFEEMRALVHAGAPPGTSPDAQQALDAFAESLRIAGDQFNAFSVIALFGMGIPTIMPIADPPVDFFKPAVLFSIGDQPGFLGWAALFALAGILLGSFYLEIIARPVRHASASLPGLLQHWAHACLRVLTLVLACGIGGLLLFIPLGIAALVLSLLSPGLGVFFILAIWLLIMWAALYLAFVIPAIFISGASVRQAIVNSITVFRYNFWPAVGLVFLIVLIQMGFSVIWQQLLDSSPGLLVGMVANAVLGTAMIAAGMLFYYDRFTWLTEVRERIRQQHRPSVKS